MGRQTRSRLQWLPGEIGDDELDEQLVREVLLAQHDRLRALLKALDARALEVVRCCGGPAPDLRGGLENAAQALSDHMRGEERALATLLPRGGVSAQALAELRAEHAYQREEIASMRRLAACSDDAISLALAVRAFAADVQLDMDLEDRNFLLMNQRAHISG